MSNSVKENSATSNQLSFTVTTHREALLSAGNRDTQAAPAVPFSNQEDLELTRELDHKQRQILVEASKDLWREKAL